MELTLDWFVDGQYHLVVDEFDPATHDGLFPSERETKCFEKWLCGDAGLRKYLRNSGFTRIRPQSCK